MSNKRLTPTGPHRRSDGFTLLEILVVIAILGILSAIAIQQYSAYKSRSVDTQMKSDLKNAALAMESYFSEFRVYPNSLAKITSVGFRQTDGVSLAITVVSPSAYTLTASKPNGSQVSFTYNSTTGQVN
jgi:type IV pilus assembly protein PilA